MKDHVGFIAALSGVCKGTAVFYDLRRNSWKRTVWHLFLLSLLLALPVAWSQRERITPLLNAQEDAFVSTFGSILHLTQEGIAPDRDPARSRVLRPLAPSDSELPVSGVVIYHAATELPALELAKYNALLYWPRRGALSYALKNGEKWNCVTLSGAKAAKTAGAMDDTSMEHLIRDGRLYAPAFDFGEASDLPVADLFAGIRNTFAVMVYLQMLAELFLLPWLFVAVYMLMFRFSAGQHKLPWSEFGRIGIYAGFPAMLVGVLFPILELPLLSYSSAYMIGWIIYWMVAAGSLERRLKNEENGEFRNE